MLDEYLLKQDLKEGDKKKIEKKKAVKPKTSNKTHRNVSKLTDLLSNKGISERHKSTHGTRMTVDELSE